MNENILVIHQGALGDVILSFPAVVALKRERGASIALLASNQTGRIAHEMGIVNSHFPSEGARFFGLFAQDLSPEMSAFVSRFDGIVVISFSRALENRIRRQYQGQVNTITPRPAVGEEIHVAVHIMRQMAAKGLLVGNREPWMGRSCVVEGPASWNTVWGTIGSPSMRNGKGAASTDGFGESKKERFVIHPGAGSPRKRWGLGNFVELAEVIKEATSGDVVFLIGPAEKDLWPSLTEAAAAKLTYVHQVDDLSSVAGLIHESRCFVGNDSGLAHLAGFLGVPTVAIFGPSSTERWSPLGKAVKALRGALECTPCFETKKHNCEDPKCLKDVSVERVVAAMKDLGVV